MFKKVIVGIDFTDKTERAISVAFNLAKAVGGGVVLVHVVPPGSDSQPSASGSEPEVMRTIEQRLQEEAARLSAQTGVTVDYGVSKGSASEELVKYVQRWGGDVIVVGTQARTGLDRILIGSVTERVLASSPVPVLVAGPALR